MEMHRAVVRHVGVFLKQQTVKERLARFARLKLGTTLGAFVGHARVLIGSRETASVAQGRAFF
jgi:hypothetical protein